MALVITIVIIIILATITINMVFGDNGLVEKAEQAKNMTEEAVQKEQGGLANATAWLNEIIYGEGSGGNTGANEETPGTNSVETNGTDTNTDANSTDTNSVDANTIEPPPVEIPDGEEEGAIIFGSPTWTDGKANVTISTETEYKIEYQVNKTEEGSWTELSLEGGTKQGTVTGLNNNDTIYARLTDGTNHGKETSTTIKDSIAPTKASIEISKDSIIKGSAIEAKVSHTDNETGVAIGKCKWIVTNSANELGTEEGSYTSSTSGMSGTFTNNGETITIPTKTAGEYYLHVLTVDKAENKVETISNKITVKEITGSIDVKGPTWKDDGTAEIEISTDNPDVTIKYQVNDDEWKEYEGPITGLKNGDTVNIKLTNGEESGEEKTIEIKDENPPEVEVTVEDKTTSEITVDVSAKDAESGIGENEAYTYYIKKTNEPDSNYVKVESTNNPTYIFTGLEQGTRYDIKVEVTDRAGNTGSGEIKEQTTNTLPGGEDSTESGAIAFGTESWANEEASITISTNTEYTLQYQINGTETEGWKEIASGGSITGLKHNDKVYARLTDGTNYGEPASKVITDTIVPEKATINLNRTEAIAGETLQATVAHKDNESGVDIAKSKWVFNTSSTNIGTEDTSYTGEISGTFTSNNETINIVTKDVGTYYLHVLTIDRAGNKLETISEAIVLKQIEGDIEIGVPIWNAGTASVTLSTAVSGYTIQYKINSGNWQNLADLGGENTGTSGTVTGLNNNDKITVRLTNGSQYGDEAETTIKDSTMPQVVITASNKVTNSITVNAEAKDNETGLANSLTYTYYIKKTSESDYVQKDTNTVDNASNNSTVTDSYTFEGLEQGTSYDIKVEVQGDKAGNKGSGTLLNQTTSTLPGGETGLEEGAISFGAVTWSNGLAQTSISTNTSYSIEYQVATGEPIEENWKTIANNGQVTGINNNSIVYARLTDGVNYGEYASITIKDIIVPNIVIENFETDEATINVKANGTDEETGIEKYIYYIKETSQSDDNYENRGESTTGAFEFDNLIDTIQYSIKVEAIDKAGNKAMQTYEITKYGGIVTNYSSPNAEGVNQWKIFYSDENNVYLIADDYVSWNYLPKSKKGSGLSKNSESDYGAWFTGVYSDYAGATDITNEKVKSWLKYLETYPNSSSIAMKSIAYMLDTDSWQVFKGSDADYAIGGPTIDMFVASYNKTHPNKTIEYNITNENGYEFKWNSDTEYAQKLSGLNVAEDIYVINSTDKASRMWLASPAASDANALTRVSNDGIINYYNYNYSGTGFRPVVCLKKETIIEKQEEGKYAIKKEGMDASEISKAPADYYGAEVKGYTCESLGVEKWRIYYADNTNIYLIADDVISYDKAPNGQKNSEIGKREDYVLEFGDVVNDYDNSSWIKENSKASKWLSQYLDITGNYEIWEPARATAYMMDTNVWGVYAGEYAEYAMGGPTLELFCASYKDTHPNKYVECIAEDGTFAGYEMKWNTGTTYAKTIKDLKVNNFNGIYFKGDSTRNTGSMWLASPLYYISDYMPAIEKTNGTVNISNSLINSAAYPSSGFRPIVCLKSDTLLELLEDGSFMIKGTDIFNIKTAEEIAKEPIYYGREVKGYTCTSSGVNKWRIYYADNTNIYLIADDYIAIENIPNGQEKTKVTQGDNKYMISFDEVINDYSEGASWIKNNSKAKKWINKFLEKNGTSTYNQVKATAYLMDTNIWNIYAGERAEYALGGPTIELFCASYKKTHPKKYVEITHIDGYGYGINSNGETSASSSESVVAGDFNNIYIIADNTKAEGAWLASPSYNSRNDYMFTTIHDEEYGGSIKSELYYRGSQSLRPVVCLKPEVKLQLQLDGSFAIVE